jgi:lipopolysaccharide export system protein LptA
MINKIFLITILFLLISSQILASDGRLYLIHADSSLGKIVNGEKVRYLVGRVEAYQDTLKMFCDHAVFYEDRNIAEFTGNVLIDDSHHKLWGDKIIYETDSRTANCMGHVRISGINDSLYAEKFVYKFRGGNAWAEKNLFIWDKQNNVRVKGDAGEYIAESQESHIRGRAYFEHHTPNQPDTLIITSKKMAYYGAEPSKAVAEDSVLIFKGDVRASCDSAAYYVSNELVAMRINPVAWQAENEMTGLKIDFTLDSLKIDEIFIYEKAQIKSLADTLENKYNILKGKMIQVSMIDGVPETVIARRNAISIYQIEENKINQGTNSASSDSIIVYFMTGELDSISIIGGTEGTYYPAEWKGDIESEY